MQLNKYLTSKQKVLLSLFTENSGITELAHKTKLSRDEILFQLMVIGRCLAYFEIMECDVVPSIAKRKSKEYLQGWLAFKKTLLKVVKNEKISYNKTI